MSLYPGLYEQVINNDLTHELAEIPDACKAVAPIQGRGVQGSGAVPGGCGAKGPG